jgi:hypothetical protein
MKKAKENDLLNKSNEVAQLQLTLEKYKTHSLQLQEEVDKFTEKSGEKTKELGQIIACVGNLWERCEESFRERHNKPILDKSQDRLLSLLPLAEQCDRIQSKLKDIAQYMDDYRAIIEDYAMNVNGNNINNGDIRLVSLMSNIKSNRMGGNNNNNNSNNNNVSQMLDGQSHADHSVHETSTIGGF